jgi:hypothetical protein
MVWNLQTAWNFVAVHIAKNRQTTIQKINIYDFHQSCGKQPQHVKYQKFRHDCPKNGSAFGFGCFPLVRNFFLPLRRQGKYHWRKHSRTIGHTLKWCRKGIQTCKTVVMRPATENCCFCGVCCAFSHLGLIFLSRTATSRLGSTTLTRNHGEHVMAWDVLVASKKQKCFGLILPRWEHMQWLVAYRLRVCISLDRWWKMVPIFFGNKVLT